MTEFAYNLTEPLDAIRCKYGERYYLIPEAL